MMGFGKHKELSFIDWFKGKIDMGCSADFR